MDEKTVTISLLEYNQLRDEALNNRFMFDKVVGYETQLNDLRNKVFELEQKMHSNN